MKSITVLLSFLIALSPLVVADEHLVATASLNAEAGVTPDSIFYGLEKAMEKVQSALTRAPEARAELHLKLAEERLVEAETMANVSNSRATERAMEGYEESVSEAEESAARLDGEARTDVEARLETHLDVLRNLRSIFEENGIAGLAGIDVAIESSQNSQARAGLRAGADSDENESSAEASADANLSA